MVRPANFGFNQETAASNSFQNNLEIENVSAKAQAEFDKAVEILRSKKIALKIFEDLPDRILTDSVFPNNWISHNPNGPLVIYPMLSEVRRAEVRSDIIDWCNENLHPESIIDLTDKADEGIFLEGTGSIVFDYENKVAYACISPRTNLQLLSSLIDQIGYELVSFESVDLNGQQIYHTNVMMSVGKHVVLICLESIEDNLERAMLKESLKKAGKSIIELSYSQMNAFAGNALEVSNNEGKLHYLMSETAYNSLDDQQKAIISRESEIVPLSIPTIEQIGGGSVRCMLAGMFLS